MGTKVAKILESTDPHSWRYVDSVSNPADDITRGKTLRDLAETHRWSQGPPFLFQAPESWPIKSVTHLDEETSEL